MKKTIQRVLAAVILFAMILSGGFSEVGKVHAEKQQGTTKRAMVSCKIKCNKSK